MPEDFKLELETQKSSFDRLFAEPSEIEFINPEIDLDIDPDQFIKWLDAEKQLDGNTYAEMVSSMCEYSCLFLAMKFMLQKLKGELKIQQGNFGFWEHFWCEYHIDGKVYIIDLTLQQFVPTAPRLAISEAKYSENGYRIEDSNIVDYSVSIKDYCVEKGAFLHYTMPTSIK